MNKRNKNIVFWVITISLVVFFHLGNNLDADEGYTLAGAWNLYNGVDVYSGFFTYVTPAAFYLVLFFWKLFGVSYLTANLPALLSFVFALWGIKKMSGIYIKTDLVYAPPLAYLCSSALWPLINHNSFNLAFIVWSLYFILVGLQKKRLIYFFSGGLLLGLSFWFLQHKSLIIFLLALLYLSYLGFKKLIDYKPLIAFSATFTAAILPILFIWPLDLLYNDLFMFPLTRYMQINRVSHLYLYIYLLALAFYAIVLQNRHFFPDKALFRDLVVFQIILYLSTFNRPDRFHVLSFAFPLLIIITHTLGRLIKEKQWPQLYKALVPALVIFILSVYPARHLFRFQQVNAAIIKDEVSRLCSDSEYIYAGPFLPNMYFETRKLNSSPLMQLVTNFHTKEQFDQVLTGIREKRPECALLNYQIAKKFNHQLDNPVDRYIMDNYGYVESIGNLMIYKVK